MGVHAICGQSGMRHLSPATSCNPTKAFVSAGCYKSQRYLPFRDLVCVSVCWLLDILAMPKKKIAKGPTSATIEAMSDEDSAGELLDSLSRYIEE
jgi:hypothetical protein